MGDETGLPHVGAKWVRRQAALTVSCVGAWAESAVAICAGRRIAP